MAGNRPAQLQEFTSEQLKAELIEIKERLGSLETIASLSNREIVEKYVLGVLKSDEKKAIMRACETPKDRKFLKDSFGYGSSPALDYHLNPLRHNDLLHESRDASGTQVFHWSKLFKNLPKSTRDRLMS